MKKPWMLVDPYHWLKKCVFTGEVILKCMEHTETGHLEMWMMRKMLMPNGTGKYVCIYVYLHNYIYTHFIYNYKYMVLKTIFE